MRGKAGGGGRGRGLEQKDEEEEGMTIAELMAQMEKEDGRRGLSLSSSNGGQYGNDANDYDDNDEEVLVTYKVSSAAEAIQPIQTL